MQISVDLKSLEQLREYPDKELVVALKIESELKLLLQNSKSIKIDDSLLIQRQLDFVKEEITTLKKREKLLTNIYDIFCESLRTSRENMKDIVQNVSSS